MKSFVSLNHTICSTLLMISIDTKLDLIRLRKVVNPKSDTNPTDDPKSKYSDPEPEVKENESIFYFIYGKLVYNVISYVQKWTHTSIIFKYVVFFKWKLFRTSFWKIGSSRARPKRAKNNLKCLKLTWAARRKSISLTRVSSWGKIGLPYPMQDCTFYQTKNSSYILRK